LKEKEAFLVANRAILVKETTFSVEQLKSVMDLYTNNMDQVTNSILKKNRLIREYEKQIAALQKQIADRFGKQQLPSGEISVSVSCGKPVSGRMTFSYVVSNAGWYPSYDIRVDDITKPVTIFYKANVFQNTGVTWKDVKLSFSNATPWVAGDVPVLDPWFVDYYYPAPSPSVRIRGTGSGEERAEARVLKDAAVTNYEIKIKEMEAAPVTVEKQVGETTVTFDISVPYSILSDGKVQTIEIQRTTTPAEYKYVTIPKLTPLAYLTGNITDWAKQNLIGGEATLYFENTFVGKSYLNVNQLKDTLTVSLGTDNSILVKREKRQDFTSKRVLGPNKTETYSFLITVRNNKGNPVKITVNDQIPISSNSGIEVDAVELSRGKHNSQTGEIRWDLEIKPQETRELILTYSVKYPKDKTIILE
ncbi:MAG: muiA, partial [Bacteroidetes bacterium]|nr:muiA [Bacteroidota bacterium]